MTIEARHVAVGGVNVGVHISVNAGGNVGVNADVNAGVDGSGGFTKMRLEVERVDPVTIDPRHLAVLV